ncbi:MAG: hypothetical protein VXZ15_15680 [Planctomycetota bacterium]|jgi:hypothetical protein|nr:hypothetical protein [Planctomycetota bacterium]MEC7447943.1 hypothetical protein [Planctomycetota bacterium]MEC7498660.1 hypothetical protein [Planctomycetota bacterium]MEC7718271.1 hypothetical protein [Planctomycetota bacterium]MEC8569723.1 hypothetical protein [Planctomycetota bacterium]
MILYVTQDLMLGSRIKSHAQDAGTEVSLSLKLPEAAQLAPETEKCLIDLECCKGKLAAWVTGLGERRARLELIGYAPHVQESTLMEAKEVGLDQVLTRGQFNHQILELLA